jgi:hypothetical protein
MSRYLASCRSDTATRGEISVSVDVVASYVDVVEYTPGMVQSEAACAVWGSLEREEAKSQDVYIYSLSPELGYSHGGQIPSEACISLLLCCLLLDGSSMVISMPHILHSFTPSVPYESLTSTGSFNPAVFSGPH